MAGTFGIDKDQHGWQTAEDARVATQVQQVFEFVHARLLEDVGVLGDGRPTYAVDLTAHVSSEPIADIVRRYSPDWVRRDAAVKLTILSEERQRFEESQRALGSAYRAPLARVLSALWKDHDEFDPSWLPGPLPEDF